MNLAYYLHLNYSRNSGVYIKVSEQIKYWVRAGHKVTLILVSNRSHNESNLKNDTNATDFVSLPYISGRAVKSVLSRFNALRKASDLLQKLSPDIVYMRQDLYYPSAYAFLNKVRTVIEINTDDLAEYRALSRTRFLWHTLTRNKMLSSVSGAVYVTEELKNKKHFSILSAPSIVIANGYDIIGTPVSVDPKQPPIRLLFLGSAGMPWHGVDKLKTLAEANPTWAFDIVGVDRKEAGIPIPTNMVFHGVLSRDEYEPLMHRATIAVGTLALHRKNMGEACALKTREYLAYGLPVIIGYKDTDFQASSDFLLQLPNTETNVSDNLHGIREFANKWNGRRVDRHSVLHLDVSHKEEKRLAFFGSLLMNTSA